MTSTLTFEEFHAERKRERAVAKFQNDKGGPDRPRSSDSEIDAADRKKPSKPREEDADVARKNPETRSARERIGRFVELFEVQLFMTALVFVDLVSAYGELVLAPDAGGSGGVLSRMMRSLARSGSNLTLTCFVAELSVLVYTFGRTFFRHLGYSTEALLVLALLRNTLLGGGGAVRILGFLRLWRLIRLVDAVADAEKGRRRLTEIELEGMRSRADDLERTLAFWKERSNEEEEARGGAESVLRRYKEEIDTLTEALRIAAADVAKSGRPLDAAENAADDERLATDEFHDSKEDVVDHSARE